MAKTKKEVLPEKDGRGRKAKPEGTKVKAMTFYAMEKNHAAITEKVIPIIKRLDK